MTKFKVGDKVRVIQNGMNFGREGFLVEPLNSNVWKVKSSNGQYDFFLYERSIEKVEEDVTQEYEVGKPYLWFGGECPLPPGTEVEVRFGKSDFSEINKHWHREVFVNKHWHREVFAGDASWNHEFSVMNIVMFKVVEYPKKTRKVELELSEEEITTIKEVLGKANL